MAEARVCIQTPEAGLKMTVRNDDQRRFVHRFLREFAGGPESVDTVDVRQAVENARTGGQAQSLEWLFGTQKEDNNEQ